MRTQLVTSNKLFAHLLESGTAILEIQDIVNACITVLDTPPRVLVRNSFNLNLFLRKLNCVKLSYHLHIIIFIQKQEVITYNEKT